MLTVAVTGGIGSGKSTLSAVLGELGGVVVDSDRLARDVVAAGTPGLAAVAAEFGAAVIAPDGSLDRPALAALVFGDAERRGRLEGITHPLVRDRFARVLADADPAAIIVNDIPILRDLSVAATYHLVVGVRADAEERVRRLMARGLTEPDARARIAAQIGDEERDALCDVLLDNSGPEVDLAPGGSDAVARPVAAVRAEPARRAARAPGWPAAHRARSPLADRGAAAGGAGVPSGGRIARRAHRFDVDPGAGRQGRDRSPAGRRRSGPGGRWSLRPCGRPASPGSCGIRRTARIPRVTTRRAGSRASTPTPIPGEVSTST